MRRQGVGIAPVSLYSGQTVQKYLLTSPARLYSPDQYLPTSTGKMSQSHKQHHVHSHSKVASLAKGFGFLLPAAILSAKFPSEPSSFILPSDPKVWLKLLLGLAGTQHLMKALPLQSLPWVQSDKHPHHLANWAKAIGNVTVMSLLLSGKQGLKTLPVLAPLVGLMVAATDKTTEKLEAPLQERFKVPPLLTHVALAGVSMLAAFKAIPAVLKQVLRLTGEHGLSAKQSSGTALLTTCSRGCCPSAVCVSELSEMAAASFSSVSAAATSLFQAEVGKAHHKKKDSPFPALNPFSTVTPSQY